MLDELVKTNTGTERLETKFEKEISDLKATLQQEIDGIKWQNEKSMTTTKQTNTTVVRSKNVEPGK